MRFIERINPGPAIADFLAVWRGAGRTRWAFAGVAVCITIAVFSVIANEETRIPPRLPTITYINSWRADRSDAEILTTNRLNQQSKDALAARQTAADNEVKHIYKVIGRASGMDVEAIDRQAKADDARAAALAKARADALLASERRNLGQ